MIFKWFFRKNQNFYFQIFNILPLWFLLSHFYFLRSLFFQKTEPLDFFTFDTIIPSFFLCEVKKHYVRFFWSFYIFHFAFFTWSFFFANRKKSKSNKEKKDIVKQRIKSSKSLLCLLCFLKLLQLLQTNFSFDLIQLHICSPCFISCKAIFFHVEKKMKKKCKQNKKERASFLPILQMQWGMALFYRKTEKSSSFRHKK